MSLRIGVLGVAEISPLAIFRAIAALPGAKLVAIASRREGAARTQASQHGLDCDCLDSYQALLARPDIDWVYIPAANAEHRPWTQAALEHDKHVLLEKPATLDSAEFESLIALARERGLSLVEAIMTRHHPWQSWLAEQVQSRTWGRLLNLSTRMRHGLRDSDHFRLQAGGGVLWDDGVYWLQTVQAVTGSDLNLSAIDEVVSDSPRIPTRVQAALRLSEGVQSRFDAEFALPRQATHGFEFERATVTLSDFFRARIGRHKIHLDIAHASGENERISFDEQNYYFNQLNYLAGDAHTTDWLPQARRSTERIALLQALHERLQQNADVTSTATG